MYRTNTSYSFLSLIWSHAPAQPLSFKSINQMFLRYFIHLPILVKTDIKTFLQPQFSFTLSLCLLSYFLISLYFFMIPFLFQQCRLNFTRSTFFTSCFCFTLLFHRFVCLLSHFLNPPNVPLLGLVLVFSLCPIFFAGSLWWLFHFLLRVLRDMNF